LEELLADYEDIFAMNSEYHGRTNKVYHHIDMEDAESTSPGKEGKVICR
jgi:hypothetical protein